MIGKAIGYGYRHKDTPFVYENEKQIASSERLRCAKNSLANSLMIREL